MPRLIAIADQVAYARAELSMYRLALPAMAESGDISSADAEARLALAEAVVESLVLLLPPNPNAEQITKPVVVHFRTESERNAFVALMADALSKNRKAKR